MIKGCLPPPVMPPGSGPGYFGAVSAGLVPSALRMLQARHMWIISSCTTILIRLDASAFVSGFIE